MRYDDALAAVRAQGLDIYGAFHPVEGDDCPEGAKTLLMLGP
jgi:hypothetical protein